MSTLETEGFLSREAEAGEAIFKKRFSRVLGLAEDVNSVAIRKLGEAKLGKSSRGHFVLYLLTIRIIESYEAVIILMRRGLLAPAKLIIRPMLETLFTLAALQRDASLVDKYFDMQEKAHLEQLRSSTRWRDEVLKRAFKEAGLEKQYIEKKKALKETPPQTLRPIEWAQEAGYEDFYHVYYVHYASFTHSNIAALEDHIERTGDDFAEASPYWQ